MERIWVTAGAGAAPLPSRSTSTADAVPADTANAQRPSGVAATPCALPSSGTVAVSAEPSTVPVAVAAEHPGDASARAGSTGAGPEPPGASAAAEAVTGPEARGGVAVEAPPEVHAVPAPSVTVVTRQAVTARRAEKPRPIRSSVGRAGQAGAMT